MDGFGEFGEMFIFFLTIVISTHGSDITEVSRIDEIASHVIFKVWWNSREPGSGGIVFFDFCDKLQIIDNGSYFRKFFFQSLWIFVQKNDIKGKVAKTNFTGLKKIQSVFGIFGITNGFTIYFIGFTAFNSFKNHGNETFLSLFMLCRNGFEFTNSLILTKSDIPYNKPVFTGKGVQTVKHEIYRIGWEIFHTDDTNVFIPQFREPATHKMAVLQTLRDKRADVRFHFYVMIGNTVMKIGQCFLLCTGLEFYEVIFQTAGNDFTFVKEFRFHLAKMLCCSVIVL